MGTDAPFIAGFCSVVLLVVGILIFASMRKGKPPLGSVPLSPVSAFWAIFCALWVFSLSAVIALSLVQIFIVILAPIGPPAP